MLGCLITLSPLLGGSERRVLINLCSVADRRVTGLGGTRWEPAVTQAPALGMQFWNGDFEQGTDAGKVDFTFNLEQTRKAYPQVVNAVWMGALVEIWIGVVGAPGQWKRRFKGRVTSYAGGEYPAVKISASVDIEPFNLDLLEVYKGTTGAEGGADLKDKPKPLALGRPRNVEPVLINAVDSVYQFSAYGPIEGVEVLYERASAFPAPNGDYASYDALVAATIQPGRWATCLSKGMVRLGAPAAGVITGDIRGHAVAGVAPTGAGAVVRVMADIAGVDATLLATSSLAALDAEGATASDVMVTDQVKFLEAARRVILPCNWQVVVSNLGVLRAMKPAFAASASMVIHAQGRREPLVSTVTEEAVSVPYAKTTMAAERNWRTQSLDEIASDVTLILRGDYDPAVVYREGNIVTMPGGSRWQYVASTPQAGITPGSDPSVWATMEAPGRYSDGTPYDALQPAEADAQITRTINVAETTLTIKVDKAGVPIAGQLPATVRATLTEANYDVTLQSDWSLSLSGGVTASIDNTSMSPTKGQVTLTGVTGSGAIEVHALRGGVAAVATISVTTKGELADLSEVETGNIADNAVSESNFNILELYGASVGSDDDNVWRNFAYGGVSLTATFNNPAGGADATASFDVTVAGVRTGGDNDRVSLRVIRDDGVVCMPAEWSNLLFESGGQQSYSVPFFDPDPPVGTSVYTVQTKNLTGHPAWQRGVIRPLRLSK